MPYVYMPRPGLLFSVLITAVLTDAIKDGVGRPRPNFFWRCFPDGVPVSSKLLNSCFSPKLQCSNFRLQPVVVPLELATIRSIYF